MPTKSKKSTSKLDCCDNFRIIVSDDIMLAKSIVSSKYENDYGKAILLDDALANRQLFIGKSFLDKSKKCYICKNIDNLAKSDNLWDDILSGKYLNGNVLVYICDKLDSRTKFAKKFKSNIFTVKPESVDISEIYPDCKCVSKDNRDELFKRCNYSVTKFLLEFHKLLNYKDYFDSITPCSEHDFYDINDIFDLLMSNNCFVNMVNDDMFKLSEYIMTQQIDKVYKFIEDANKTDFDFGLLSVLYNNFRNLYIYGCASKTGRLDTTSLSSFIQKNMSRYLQYYNSQRILKILSFLQNLDYKIKSGNIDSDYALNYMLCGVLSK